MALEVWLLSTALGLVLLRPWQAMTVVLIVDLAYQAYLGAIKLGVGLLFGTSIQELCGHFPACVLGLLLAFSGLELAAAALRGQVLI